MKLAILNDTHTGARNASDVFLNYIGKFYSDVFFPYCKENGIKQIIHLGDFYDHRKYINFKALHHSRKTFLEPLRENGMSMDIIPGNHDVVYKNTNELCSLKELLGYFVENVNIIMEPKVMDYAGCKIAMLPWINPENYADSMKFVETCEASILGAHLELEGFEMMKGMPCSHGMPTDPFSRFEMVLSGHYHTKSTKGNIHYLGTQFEMFWSDVDDPKFFHVFDTETRELTSVLNPLTIFTKIIYNDKDFDYDGYDVTDLRHKFIKILVVNKTDLFAFDRFLDRIQKQDVFEIKIAENFDEFLGSNVDSEDLEKVSDTSELIGAYVDATQTDLDKDVIKTRLRELFIEAQNLETA
jgi:DNA repair exonuclease SbcCD nuclease subunit